MKDLLSKASPLQNPYIIDEKCCLPLPILQTTCAPLLRPTINKGGPHYDVFTSLFTFSPECKLQVRKFNNYESSLSFSYFFRKNVKM